MAVVRCDSRQILTPGGNSTVVRYPASATYSNGSTWVNFANTWDGDDGSYGTIINHNNADYSATYQFGAMGVPTNSCEWMVQYLFRTDGAIDFRLYAVNGALLDVYQTVGSGSFAWRYSYNGTFHTYTGDLNGCYVVVPLVAGYNPDPALATVKLALRYSSAATYGDVTTYDIAVSVNGGKSNPIDAAAGLLTMAGSDYSVSASATVPTTDIISGAIVESATIGAWLHSMAWQARCWVRMTCGNLRLIYRDAVPTPVATISAVRAVDGVAVWSRSRVTTDNILNIINLRYGRDYQRTGDAAYSGLITVSNAASRSTYGDHERPELFLCDLITDSAWATSLADYYLTYLLCTAVAA